MPDRYAIYFAPHALSSLWAFGCSVLGYDAETGLDVLQKVPPGLAPDRFRALTEDPRRYGFHATLKAPFRLAAGRSVEDLIVAFEAFAATRSAFVLPALEVQAVGAFANGDAFMALVERSPTPDLLALEYDIVHAFEPFRAPLTPEDIARRRPERLTPRQRENLDRYGYPGVLDEFRFHLSLTGRVPGAERDAVLHGLAEAFAADVPAGPVPVDGLALFRQRPGERFTLVKRALFV